MADNGFVKEFTLTNCYVDTSYQKYDGTIITSKFSESEPQTDLIRTDFTIVANDGFELNPEFTFKVQLQYGNNYNPELEWDTITQNDLSPIDKPLTWTWNFEKGDYKFKGLDINNSLIYTKLKSDGTVLYHLLLVGGFNPYKLMFVLLYPDKYGKIKYDNVGYSQNVFYYNKMNRSGGYETLSLLNNLVLISTYSFKSDTFLYCSDSGAGHYDEPKSARSQRQIAFPK